MTKAAPGPYSTVEIGCGTGFHAYVVDANGRKIAAVWGPVAEKVWTSALFAAAPKMLETLKLVAAQFTTIDNICNEEAVAAVLAAIAKATGEQS